MDEPGVIVDGHAHDLRTMHLNDFCGGPGGGERQWIYLAAQRRYVREWVCPLHLPRLDADPETGTTAT